MITDLTRLLPGHFSYTRTLLGLIGVLSMTACTTSPAIIHYSQPANAYLFTKDSTQGPHTTTTAGNGIFAFYCINTIENKGTNAKKFNFDLSKVYVPHDTSNTAGNTSFSSVVQTAPSTLTVPPNTTSSVSGRIVINVQGEGDPQSLKTQLLNLSYKTSSGESVLLMRDGGSNPPPVTFLSPASAANPDNLPSCK